MSDESLERQSELQRLYLKNMQIIKWRIEAISDIRAGKRTTTYKKTNIEFCILQIRKILELIALSSLISDADIYKTHLTNVEKMWNARLIIQDIERIHPDFFPKAIYIDPNDKSKWLDRTEPCLTKDKFLRIYERCGRFLHEPSPFLSDKDVEEEYESVWKDIQEWVQLIINLLSTHIVHLYNQKDLFYISMGRKNEKPYGNIFTLVEDSEEQTNG